MRIFLRTGSTMTLIDMESHMQKREGWTMRWTRVRCTAPDSGALQHSDVILNCEFSNFRTKGIWRFCKLKKGHGNKNIMYFLSCQVSTVAYYQNDLKIIQIKTPSITPKLCQRSDLIRWSVVWLLLPKQEKVWFSLNCEHLLFLLLIVFCKERTGELREILKRFMGKVFSLHRHDHRKQVTIFHPSHIQDFLRYSRARMKCRTVYIITWS